MSVASEKKTEVEIEKEDSLPGEGSKYEVTLDEALKLAKAHHRNGNLTIAERTYKDILRAFPDHFPSLHLLAALLFQIGNFEESLAFGKKATEIEPDDVSCWSNYAVSLSSSDRNEEALEAFDRAISIDPEFFEAYSNKAHTLWLLERFEEAEEMAAQATLLNPKSTDAYINLGVALAAQDKLDEAQEVWQQVAKMDPNNVKAYSNWCNALRHQARFEEAIEKGLKALELNENEHETLNNLACVYKELGDLDEALVLFKRATDVKPDYYIAHSNTALTLMEADRYPEAIVSARYAVSFKKDYAEAYATLSFAQNKMGLHSEARVSANKAINIEPDNPLYYLTLVEILIATDSSDEAEAVLQKALDLGPSEPKTLVKLAEVRRDLDMMDEAIEAIDQAIANFEETPPLLLQKARILERANRVEEGLVVVDKALKMAPKNPWVLLTKADLLLTVNRKDEAREIMESERENLERFPNFFISMTSYKTFSKDDPDFEKLKEMLEKSDKYGPDGKANLHFALFKAYEDIKDYDTAFEHLKKGNDSNKELHSVNIENMGRSYQLRKKAFAPAIIKKYEDVGCKSDVPVFILGMPRSGTTLTEQIISSHPEVYGAGELYDLGSVVRELGPLRVERADAMGQAYIDKIKARDTTGNAVRITDKMPGNYNQIGLIHCILPNAKIIHCRRNAIDNCLSCYKQNFAAGHYWTSDLETLAKQHSLYTDMMDYWRKTLPEGTFLDIDYEETVTNFEEQARKLIDYVGLEWDDACLKPHKQKRAVLTASRDQVITPIYTSSVDSWKRYEKQLQPLIDGLKG